MCPVYTLFLDGNIGDAVDHFFKQKAIELVKDNNLKIELKNFDDFYIFPHMKLNIEPIRFEYLRKSGKQSMNLITGHLWV